MIDPQYLASNAQSPLFSKIGVIGIVVVLVLGFFISQQLGLYLAGMQLLNHAELLTIDEILGQGGSNGLILSVATALSAVMLVLLVMVLVRVRTSSTSESLQYLGFRGFAISELNRALGLLAIFFVINEIMTSYLGRNSTEFVDPLFATMDAKWPLIVVIVLLAPLYEELVFRGLMWQAIAEQFEPKTGMIVASVISSVIFALIHLQYELYEMSAIVVLALIFCYARARSGSLYLPIILHIINNGLTMIIYLNQA